jgi:hypothetical protein
MFLNKRAFPGVFLYIITACSLFMNMIKHRDGWFRGAVKSSADQQHFRHEQSTPVPRLPLFPGAQQQFGVALSSLLTTVRKRPGSGRAQTVVADSLLMKQQLLVINWSR